MSLVPEKAQSELLRSGINIDLPELLRKMQEKIK
jgi:hypothetical protein